MRRVFFPHHRVRRIRRLLFLVLATPLLLVAPKTAAAPLPSGWMDTGQTTAVSAGGSVSLAGWGFAGGIDSASAAILDFEFSVDISGYRCRWYLSNVRAGVPKQSVHEVPLRTHSGETYRPSMGPTFTCTRTMGPFRRGARATPTGSREYRWFADHNTRITWTCSAGRPGSVTKRYTAKPGEVVNVGSRIAGIRWGACAPYQSYGYAIVENFYPGHIRFRGLRVNGKPVATAHLDTANKPGVLDLARSRGPGNIDYNFYFDPRKPRKSECSAGSGDRVE